MKQTNQSPIYVQLEEKIEKKPGEKIFIKDIATILAENRIKKSIDSLKITEIDQHADDHMVVSILSVVEAIRSIYPEMHIIPIGETKILIKISKRQEKQENKLLTYIKLFLVCSTLFVGTGLAVMHFHADVNMAEVHEKLYHLITGVEKKRPLILQIPYSIGLGLGMALFFGHVLPRKISNDPSPMEVELFSYQNSMDEYILGNSKTQDESQPNKGGRNPMG